jgi:hypothetical protein
MSISLAIRFRAGSVVTSPAGKAGTGRVEVACGKGVPVASSVASTAVGVLLGVGAVKAGVIPSSTIFIVGVAGGCGGKGDPPQAGSRLTDKIRIARDLIKGPARSLILSLHSVSSPF